MRLAVVGAWNRNIGDRAIQGALAGILGGAHTIEWLDCQSTVFTRERLASISEEFDAILVGGGGLIWGKPELGSPSGWQFQLEDGALDGLDVPLYVNALGWPAFPYRDDTGASDALVGSLESVIAAADVFTVRNGYTRGMLRHAGVSHALIRDVSVVPDPAITFAAPRVPYREENWTPTIALCPASDKAAWRFEDGRIELARFLDRVAQGAVRAAESAGGRVVVVPHVDVADDYATEVVGQRLRSKDDEVWDRRPADVNAAIEVADLYSRVDVVFSMRKHGLLIPGGAGVPVVGLGSVREVEVTARQLGGETIKNDDDDVAGRVERAAFDALRRTDVIRYYVGHRARMLRRRVLTHFAHLFLPE